MATTDLSQFVWRKSSRTGNQGQCVEIGFESPTAVIAAIRDSKDPHGGALVLTTPQWSTFREQAKAGRFDLA